MTAPGTGRARRRRPLDFGLGFLAAAVLLGGVSDPPAAPVPPHACPGEAFPRGGSASLVHEGGVVALPLSARIVLARARSRTIRPTPGDS